jgi:signal transduction histidine kinase
MTAAPRARAWSAACGGLLLVAALHGVRAEASAPPGEAVVADVARLRSLVENDPAVALREAERLEFALPADAPGALRAALLDVRARAALYMGQAERAVALAESARVWADRDGDAAGQAEAYLILSHASIYLGRIEDSYDATTRALTRVEGVDRPELLAEAMSATAAMYQRRGQLEELVTTAMQAVEIAKRSGSPMALAHAHRALALAYTLTGRDAEGSAQYLQMLAAARAAGAGMKEADALVGLAAIAAHTDLREAERLSRDALAMFRRIGAPFNAAVALFNLADVFQRGGRHADALQVLDEMAALYGPSQNRLGLWWTLRARSDIHRAMRQPAAAEADLRRVYAIAEEVGIPFYRSESAKLLAAAAAARGDHRRAYAYLVEASEMSARSAQEGAGARIMELTRRYESESRQRQLDGLARRQQEQEMRLRQQALHERWLWTVIASGAIVLAGTAFFLVRLRRSHRLLEVANAELERRVAARTAELQATNRELEAFAYSVSHDLRAPVRQIDAFTTLLARRAVVLDAQARTYMDAISASARRMGALIEDLLAFSRTARTELIRAPVELGALAREVIRELDGEARGRSIEWIIGELPVVEGARSLLRIVLVNLLANAVKYTAPRARPHVEIGASAGADGETVVFVRDDGVGFDMRYVDKLFGVFQRLHGPEEFEGTGIGLATVRRIVNRHGGRTWAEGKVGEGATFYFSIPGPARASAPTEVTPS